MLLQEKESGDLVEILDIDGLISPALNEVLGRNQAVEILTGLKAR